MANWRDLTFTAIKANPMLYWRLRFLEEHRVVGTPLTLTEYGFKRQRRARKTLHKLAQRELDIKTVVAYRAMLGAVL